MIIGFVFPCRDEADDEGEEADRSVRTAGLDGDVEPCGACG